MFTAASRVDIPEWNQNNNGFWPQSICANDDAIYVVGDTMYNFYGGPSSTRLFTLRLDYNTATYKITAAQILDHNKRSTLQRGWLCTQEHANCYTFHELSESIDFTRGKRFPIPADSAFWGNWAPHYFDEKLFRVS